MLHLFVAALVCLNGAVSGQLVMTEYGPVRGQTLDVNLLSGTVPVTTFWGIPYAAPPVGNLRFEEPQRHEGWNTEFVASELPNMCMQSPVGLMYLTHPLWRKYSEDCLTLNIAKPANAFGLLPVLIWFHGGGYVAGGSIQYPGHFMAALDVIVVSINYRLGIFGFAATPDGTIRGNMGLYDQRMAMEWVKNNIEAFGGNPNRVTISGQSAGASSAALHIVSPKSRGLFHSAILESGAESNVWSINLPGQNPEYYFDQVAERLNCTDDEITYPEKVECVKAVDARDLRIEDHIECTPGYFCQGFAPIVDGPGGFLPKLPRVMRDELQPEDNVPILSGICKDDGSLYTIYFIPEALQGGFTEEEFQFYLRTRLVDLFKETFLSETDYENSYQAVQWYYTPWPYQNDTEANRQAFNKLVTDGAFGYPFDRNAKINSRYSDTYTYIQSFRSSNASHLVPDWMGVPHSGELPYVWSYPYLLMNDAVRADCGIRFDVVGWVPDDINYSAFVNTLWTNFLKTGNPTPVGVPAPFNNTLTYWPKFSEDSIQHFNLDTEIYLTKDYRQQDFAFFTEFISYLSKFEIYSAPSKNSHQGPMHKPTLKLNSATIRDVMTRMIVDALLERLDITEEEMENILLENLDI